MGYGVIPELDKRLLTVIEPARPLAWVACCVWPGAALDVRRPDFLRRACIARATATRREDSLPPGPAKVIAERPGWLELQAEDPGWLVTVEPWHPGWSTWVDGEPAQVEAVDGALVGVPLPDGSRTVTLRYRPADFDLGVTISVLVGLVLVASWRLDRQRAEAPRSAFGVSQ